MIDRLSRLREPLAAVALAVFAVHLLLMLGTFIVYSDTIGPVSAALSVVDRISGGLLALVAAVLVLGCALWPRPTPRARLLALIGAVLFGLTVLCGLVAGAIGLLAGNPFGTLARVLQLLVPAVAAVLLFTLYRALPASRPVPVALATWAGSGAPHPAGAPQPAQPQHPHPQHPHPQRPHPQQPPIASSGPAPAAASFWGPPGDRTVPRSESQPRSQQRGPQPPTHQSYGQQPQPQPDRADQPAPQPPAEPGDWQPAPQRPPQRLHPSPRQPAVGPHTRPDGRADEH